MGGTWTYRSLQREQEMSGGGYSLSLFKKILQFVHLMGFLLGKPVSLHSFTVFSQRHLPENPFPSAAEEELTTCAAAQ